MDIAEPVSGSAPSLLPHTALVRAICVWKLWYASCAGPCCARGTVARLAPCAGVSLPALRSPTIASLGNTPGLLTCASSGVAERMCPACNTALIGEPISRDEPRRPPPPIVWLMFAPCRIGTSGSGRPPRVMSQAYMLFPRERGLYGLGAALYRPAARGPAWRIAACPGAKNRPIAGIARSSRKMSSSMDVNDSTICVWLVRCIVLTRAATALMQPSKSASE
mmetsp:Transcript_9941/g.24992  ORF Transcript_9941/g.24992 Transcript_9941/m.24992 type:complete len:222 (-) Transcript_9941:424-1089(-)